jgi:hypothetical protein
MPRPIPGCIAREGTGDAERRMIAIACTEVPDPTRSDPSQSTARRPHIGMAET